jgi:hypothetical protein
MVGRRLPQWYEGGVRVILELVHGTSTAFWIDGRSTSTKRMGYQGVERLERMSAPDGSPLVVGELLVVGIAMDVPFNAVKSSRSPTEVVVSFADGSARVLRVSEVVVHGEEGPDRVRLASGAMSSLPDGAFFVRADDLLVIPDGVP